MLLVLHDRYRRDAARLKALGVLKLGRRVVALVAEAAAFLDGRAGRASRRDFPVWGRSATGEDVAEIVHGS